MFKKMSLLILGVVVVTLCRGIILLDRADASATGHLKFEIIQHYKGGDYSPHRLWDWGEARHWDPKGKLTAVSFQHVVGAAEYPDFGQQLVGNNCRGNARITRGLVCKKTTCRSATVRYKVKAGHNQISVRVNHPK